MKKKKFSKFRFMAVLMALVMLIGTVPVSASIRTDDASAVKRAVFAKKKTSGNAASLKEIPETSGTWRVDPWYSIMFSVNTKNMDGKVVKDGILYADDNNDRWGSSVRVYVYNVNGELVQEKFSSTTVDHEYEYKDGKVSKDVRKENGIVTQIYEYEYDPSNKAEITKYLNGDGSLQWSSIKTEKPDGSVEIKDVFPDGEEVLFSIEKDGKPVFGAGIDMMNKRQSNTSEYSYYKNGQIKQIVSKVYNWNDFSLDYTSISEYNKKGLLVKTTVNYESGSTTVSEYDYKDADNYTITNSANGVVTDYSVYNTTSNSKKKKVVCTNKDAKGKVTGKTTVVTSVQSGKIIEQSEEDASGNVTKSQKCVYDDAKNSIKLTQFADGEKTILLGSYDVKTDTMKLVYKDSSKKVTKTVEKKFNPYLIMSEVKVDGKTTFERNKDGKIVYSLEKSYVYNDPNSLEYEVREYTDSYEYDPETGELSKRTVKYTDGTLKDSYEYSYFVNNKGETIKKEYHVSEYGWTNETFYDEKDRETESIQYDKDGSVSMHQKYTYYGDSKTRKTVERIESDGRRNVTEYNKKNQETGWVTYDADGKLFDKCKLKYDKNGNHIKTVRYDSDGNIVETYKWKYDSKNRRISETHLDAADSVSYSSKYTYYKNTTKYLKITERNADGSLSRIVKNLYKKDGTYKGRIEYYYPDNVKKAADWDYFYKYDAKGRETEYSTQNTIRKTKYMYPEEYLRSKVTVEGKITDTRVPIYEEGYTRSEVSLDSEKIKTLTGRDVDKIKYVLYYDNNDRLSSGKVYAVFEDGSNTRIIKIKTKYKKGKGAKTIFKYSDGSQTEWSFDTEGREVV